MGNVIQNSSDSDATYDGHKGTGYQAQISETCGDTNDVQLITGVAVEPAHYTVTLNPAQHRLAARRAEQSTRAFSETMPFVTAANR